LKKKQLIGMLAGVLLVMALILSSCAGAATTTPPTSTTTLPPVTTTVPPVTTQVDKTYKVLNPQGTYIPVETKPLAPRLSTVDGKTILFYQSEGSPVIMPPLLARLQKTYTKTTFKVLVTQTFGNSTPGTELTGPPQLDAEIRGIAW
jgi:hypothetical protein